MTDGELAQLIGRAQARDPDAYDRIIDAFAPRLHGYLFRLTGSREDAEDLLQEVFLRVVRTLEGYEHDGRFVGWLFRIATNLARDRIRRRQRTPRTLHLEVGVPTGERVSWASAGDLSEPAPDDPLMLDEQVDALQRAVARLPAAEREVVMLRHFSGMTFAEISEAMGTPLGTTLARGHRALGKLRKWLEEEDV